jgi:hypothetical protein
MRCIPVHPVHEMSRDYFSCSGGPDVVSIKTALRHVTPNLCFFHSVGSAGHVVHSGVSGS